MSERVECGSGVREWSAGVECGSGVRECDCWMSA
jgi:hypothetical protein